MTRGLTKGAAKWSALLTDWSSLRLDWFLVSDLSLSHFRKILLGQLHSTTKPLNAHRRRYMYLQFLSVCQSPEESSLADTFDALVIQWYSSDVNWNVVRHVR